MLSFLVMKHLEFSILLLSVLKAMLHHYQGILRKERYPSLVLFDEEVPEVPLEIQVMNASFENLVQFLFLMIQCHVGLLLERIEKHYQREMMIREYHHLRRVSVANLFFFG